MSDEVTPFPKSAQLARGERRYRRKVASPKQWAMIVDAKIGPSRVHPQFMLAVSCVACRRETGFACCDLCSKMERAERDATGVRSPQLHDALIEYHHLVSRAQGGDDVADNIVPLSREGHRRVTEREPDTLAALAASLTHSEYSYLLEKVGEPGIERLFGVPGE